MENPKIDICLAGVTGWVGRALYNEINLSGDLNLTSAVSRKQAGKNISEVFNSHGIDIIIDKSVPDALEKKCDVLIDYTSPLIVKDNVLFAISRKVNVVIGTSGLSEKDFEEINDAAVHNSVGVLAAGNFSITAVLLQHFAQIAVKHIPNWEIFDYATEHKPDAPSGTTRELANRLANIQQPAIHYPIDQTIGDKSSRGATIGGMQLHSVRLPGFNFSFEIIFGLPNERLSIRHDSGNGAEPYVNGTLLAVRKVNSFVGLKRGLDTLLNI
ncbi:MAG: 4-hydroxy-tetrahydrodipicolinate reductase [Bacteroidota bacterium]